MLGWRPAYATLEGVYKNSEVSKTIRRKISILQQD